MLHFALEPGLFVSVEKDRLLRFEDGSHHIEIPRIRNARKCISQRFKDLIKTNHFFVNLIRRHVKSSLEKEANAIGR